MTDRRGQRIRLYKLAARNDRGKGIQWGWTAPDGEKFVIWRSENDGKEVDAWDILRVDTEWHHAGACMQVHEEDFVPNLREVRAWLEGYARTDEIPKDHKQGGE